MKRSAPEPVLRVRPPIVTNDEALLWNKGPFNRAMRWLGERYICAKPQPKLKKEV